MNKLDQFVERGNLKDESYMTDEFTWEGSEYPCVVSGFTEELYLQEEASSKRRNAERILDVRKSALTAGTPQIRDKITYQSKVYEITEVESEDVTNISYRIRIPIKDLLDT